jgi:hypothetical protein
MDKSTKLYSIYSEVADRLRDISFPNKLAICPLSVILTHRLVKFLLFRNLIIHGIAAMNVVNCLSEVYAQRRVSAAATGV